jgi:hypothetical protein
VDQLSFYDKKKKQSIPPLVMNGFFIGLLEKFGEEVSGASRPCPWVSIVVEHP